MLMVHGVPRFCAFAVPALREHHALEAVIGAPVLLPHRSLTDSLVLSAHWHAPRFYGPREVRSNLHHLQDR
jgi:hypothetical protein